MTTNTIIDAIGAALEFLGAEVNEDEVKQGFQENSFSIDLIHADYTRMMRNKYTGTFSFDVIYHTLSKEAAYDMADQLIVLLDNLTTDDGSIKGSNISYRYVDADALHFLITYTVSLYKPLDADPLMQTDTLTANTKGES